MKKILSLFLISIICLSSVAIVYATQQKSIKGSSPSDYCDKSYNEKCMPIDNCGVYSDAVNCILPYTQFAFEDVTNEDEWYYKPIYDVWNKGLMEGYSDRWFGVGDELTWIQTVVLAMRMEYYLVDNVYTKKHGEPEHWYSEDLANALESGVITEIPANVNAPIPRGEMAVIFSKVIPGFKERAEYVHQTKQDDVAHTDFQFNDLKDVEEDVAYAVNGLADMGIVNGKSQDLFVVNDPLKREEIAAIISRIIWFMEGGLEVPDFEN